MGNKESFVVRTMTEPLKSNYWSSLLLQIREKNRWTQSQLAEEIGVSRETIIRWEKEAKHPSLENQKLIGKLAASLNVASVYGIIEVVNTSPFPMILTDINDYVLAASKVSGFEAGKTVAEQTPIEEQDNYKKFSQMVTDSNFWDKSENTFEYEFQTGSETRKAVIQSVGSRGHIFALVQKL